MKMIFLVLATVTLASGCKPNSAPIVNSDSIQIKKGSIVGGTEVDPTKTDTSFVVSIGGGCAGSIIDERWILTAAHCKSLFSRTITAGSVDLRARDRVKLKVLRSFIHPKYSSSKSSNDFALLELTEAIDFSSGKINKIDMADATLETSGGLEDGVMSTVYGWGVTRENGSQPSIMREVDVPLVSRDRANAKDSYNNQIDDSMIAAGYDQGGKDSCQGDSGGPLVIKDIQNNTQTLIGVVSFGDGCARAKKFGIYSNVAYAQDWINSVITK